MASRQVHWLFLFICLGQGVRNREWAAGAWPLPSGRLQAQRASDLLRHFSLAGCQWHPCGRRSCRHVSPMRFLATLGV